MRHFATRFRYSEWDGSQQLDLSADDVLGAIADDLMEYGDLRWAMRNLMSRGMRIPHGGTMQGLRDMLKQLREKKRERLEQFDLSSVMKDIEEKLNEILEMEHDTIDEWLDQDRGQQEEKFSNEVLRQIAERNEKQLDELPNDTAGKVKELEKYEFLNPDAQKKFLQLLNQLRKAMTRTFFNDIEKMVNNMSQGDIERMKRMVKALNDMLVKKIAGQDPGFEDFMREFGDMFGDNPPRSLDELLEQMRQQMAAAQSLLNSMSPDQRQQLQSLLGDRFGDPELESELRKLAKEMDFLNPQGSRYNFGGDQQLDLEAAMRLMNEMHQLDELIDQVQGAERAGNLDHVDSDLLSSLLGDEARENLDDLKKLMDALENAGYIRPTGDDKWELTPRGSRMIGQKALGEIYARLRRQNLGNHAIPEEGRFGERLEQTKAYEFGDPFHLHMGRTIRNAIDRDGPSTPVRLKPEDFEIYRSELITSSATAMLVDLSWSMALRGSFQAAKKVAMALHNLITSQYPKDHFYIIGFAAYAHELKAHELPFLQWEEYVLGTNMQHALLLAERLLGKHDVGSKQIIMISDGEPTAHLEDGHAQFAYPPTPETIRATLKAVKHCTLRNVAINTFMLDANYQLKEFMDQIARINGGRVFYTSPEKLGEYILVDYVQHKRKKLGR
ncbi:MAG: VWA domain-containing protein [Gammaproteobacteria bacterium]|nr:VWA domain-containing protein [Gammaproteobacteria bacterium]